MVLVDNLTYESIPNENIRKLPSHLATDFFSNLCRIKDLSDEIKGNIQASDVLTSSVEIDDSVK